MRSRIAWDRLPVIIFSLLAFWHLAIATTAVTALVMAGWSSETWDLAWREGLRFFIFAYIALLIWDNHRLRNTPAWRATSEAFSRGYEQGARDRTRVSGGAR